MLASSKNINDYLSRFPAEIQKVLEQIRRTVKKAAPDAEETIKYGMPAFMLNGNQIYFAAFKKHVGFYPVPTGNKDFKKEFKGFKTGKGSIQFPFDKPMPIDLISKIVRYNFSKNLDKSGKK